MTLRIDRKKWILYRHTSDFKLISIVAEFLKSYSKTTISKDAKAKLNLKLKQTGNYNERNPDMPLDAISHKINQLSFYMFGYQTKIESMDMFLFSPLGNLFLKHIDDDEKAAKIFATMLWAIQYQHPHSGTDSEFQLYPFRLLFKLLLDDRLSNKLYAFEVAYFIVFVKEITEEIYENLVRELLELRKLSNEQLTIKFQKDRHAYVNSAYEWDYYVSTFCQGAGVFEKIEGELICKLQHGETNTFRKITRNEVKVAPIILNLIKKLEAQNSFLEKPLLLNDPERLKIDVVKEIYNF